MEVRSCRRHLRVYAECFTGSDAVDAVLSYLMQNVAFCTSEVSRLKAARLCQALMEAKVFEPVGTKLFRRDKEVTFEDSSCSLYRFLEYKGFSNSDVKGNINAENILPEQQEIKKKRSSRWVLHKILSVLLHWCLICIYFPVLKHVNHHWKCWSEHWNSHLCRIGVLWFFFFFFLVNLLHLS